VALDNSPGRPAFGLSVQDEQNPGGATGPRSIAPAGLSWMRTGSRIPRLALWAIFFRVSEADSRGRPSNCQQVSPQSLCHRATASPTFPEPHTSNISDLRTYALELQRSEIFIGNRYSMPFSSSVGAAFCGKLATRQNMSLRWSFVVRLRAYYKHSAPTELLKWCLSLAPFEWETSEL